MRVSRFGLRVRALVSSSVALAISGAAFAQEGAPAPAAEADESLAQIIVTGTRRSERTVLESTVPIDVVSNLDLQKTFSSDLNDKLQSLIPSYNVGRIPPADGAIFVRPARLRNLSPDHTLVLVNGKRFHRSAFVDVTARGAQAVDLSLIPSAAFKRVEVLRDGAAAQYGSDAIAGVINFILNDQPGTSAYAQFGEYSESDGRNLQVGFGTGFALGENGQINLAAEYVDGEPTSRGIQRPHATAIAALGEPYASAVASIGDVVQRYGQPELENLKAFINGSYELGGGASIYAVGNFADQSGVNDFNWRGSVNATGPDADGNVVTFARNATYRRSVFQDGPNAVYPTWDLLSLYPGGFTPRFGSDGKDWSFTTGVKGRWGENLAWDISGSTSSNRVDYWLKESINASLGPLSPTEFDDGSREQREQDANLDFVYQWQTALPTPVNVGFGLEYRNEQFRIRPGEEASWAVGPLHDLPPASNGFPGAHPLTSGTWSSSNTAAYVDFDADINARLNIDVAARFEDFTSFGTTLNGKVAGRFAFTDAIALRGAVSTGFRAPTPGQQNLYNVSQNPNAVTFGIDTAGTVPSNSAGAALFGGVPLEPEESLSLSFGLVLTPAEGLSVTLDAYQIDIDDRISISQRFALTPADRQELIAAGLPFASELTHVQFYTNGFDTRTKGIDLVGTWRVAAGPGRLGFTLASNFNETEFTRYDPAVFSEAVRESVLHSVPELTSHFSVDYSWNNFQVTGRARYFGDWTYVSGTSIQEVGAEAFLDLIGSWEFSENVNVSVGVENLLDNYAAETDFLAFRNNGRVYVGGTPYENDGRQFYARVGVRF